MLVLSRHRDESIMIGDDIVITIVDIRGDKVRLGIDAPTDIPVHRQEVYDAIREENRKAAQTDPKDTRDLGGPPGGGGGGSSGSKGPPKRQYREVVHTTTEPLTLSELLALPTAQEDL